jgi:hypothetical protein
MAKTWEEILKTTSFIVPRTLLELLRQEMRIIKNDESNESSIPQMIQWKETRDQDNTLMNENVLVIP